MKNCTKGKIVKISISALLVSLTIIGAAQAQEQTWQLTGTVTSVTPNGFTPSPFAALGQVVTVDYTVNLAAPLVTIAGTDVAFSNAITSVTFDGQTNSGGDINWDPGFLGAANEGDWSPVRNDGVTFLSLNLYNAVNPPAALNSVPSSVSAAMADFAGGIASGDTTLRIDWSQSLGQSSYVTLTSLTPVPLPAALWLLFSAIGGLGAFAGRMRAAQVRV
ncbi:MAG: VPLPA-CTERM sorting domain-containing protein [Steroidobacteraceae bacterium]